MKQYSIDEVLSIVRKSREYSVQTRVEETQYTDEGEEISPFRYFALIVWIDDIEGWVFEGATLQAEEWPLVWKGQRHLTLKHVTLKG